MLISPRIRTYVLILQKQALSPPVLNAVQYLLFFKKKFTDFSPLREYVHTFCYKVFDSKKTTPIGVAWRLMLTIEYERIGIIEVGFDFGKVASIIDGVISESGGLCMIINKFEG